MVRIQKQQLSDNSDNKETGQGLVEYALILVLVAVVVIVVLAIMGPQIGNIFSNLITAIEDSSNIELVDNSGGGGAPAPQPNEGDKCYGYDPGATTSEKYMEYTYLGGDWHSTMYSHGDMGLEECPFPVDLP